MPKLPRGKNGKVPPRQLYVVEKRAYLAENEAIAAAHEAQRWGEPTTIDVEALIAELNEAIERLRERKPEEIGQVIRRRGNMGGVPIIAGTRIPTETIAWFHDHGYSLSEILENYPRLTPEDVKAAVEFESARKGKTTEPALMHG